VTETITADIEPDVAERWAELPLRYQAFMTGAYWSSIRTRRAGAAIATNSRPRQGDGLSMRKI
jgi:hypothetical protein